MTTTPSANFAYLGHHDPRLVAVATQAERLFAEDPNACLIKLRLFGGMSIEDAARCLGISRASAYRHWTYARAWLLAERQG